MLTRGGKRPKVMIIGLDCAAPELVLDRWLPELPNIRQVVNAGVSGKLESSIPPITVPAWMSMMTGCDPGELGLYGFHNRADHTYANLRIASSGSIVERTLWDRLGEDGRHSIVIGVPPSYPVKPLRGELISCFLTPSGAPSFTWPAALGDEVRGLVGDYLVDARDFRTDDKDRLLRDIYEMTEKRFKVARHLLGSRDWDFFAMVEIGLDRMHHAFWHFMDEQHVLYPGPTRFADEIFKYHRFVDGLVGELLEFVDDDTRVLIVSDHGAKRMDGSVALNEWLIAQGHLVLNRYPDRPVRFAELDVNWQQTRAWGEGGYYGRVFINRQGREPAGVVSPDEYEPFRRQLARDLAAIPDAAGRPLDTRVELPEEIYREVRNIAPDLFVFFGDLYWRAAGTVGRGTIHLQENDTGPDGANHDWHGIFAMADGRALRQGRQSTETRKGLRLLDVAPTVLCSLGVAAPAGMRGQVVQARS